MVSAPSSDSQVAASVPPSRARAVDSRSSSQAPNFGSLVDSTVDPSTEQKTSATGSSASPSGSAPAKAASSARTTDRSDAKDRAGGERSDAGTANRAAGDGQAAGDVQQTGGDGTSKTAETGLVVIKSSTRGGGTLDGGGGDGSATDSSSSDAAAAGSPTTQLVPVAVLIPMVPTANQISTDASTANAEAAAAAGKTNSQLSALAALQAGKGGNAAPTDAAASADAAATTDNGAPSAATGLTQTVAASTNPAAKDALKKPTALTAADASTAGLPTATGDGTPTAQTGPGSAQPTTPTADKSAKPAVAEATAKDGAAKTEAPGREAAAAPSPISTLAHHLQAELTGNSLPGTASLQNSAPQNAPTAAAAASPANPVAVPMSGLAVEISSQLQGGHNRFEIRLDPPELGRIDVRLDVDKASGQVTSHLTVDKPETLDLLRRDAPQLQRALEDAGLKTGDSGLQFSLRDQSSFAGGRDDGQSGRNAQRLIIPEDDAVPVEIAGRSYGRMLGTSSGVDIRV